MAKEYIALPRDEDDRPLSPGGGTFPPWRVMPGRQTPSSFLRIISWVVWIGTVLALSISLAACLATDRNTREVMIVSHSLDAKAPRLLKDAQLEDTRPPPLTKLGYIADDTYELLAADSYRHTLVQFIREVMPQNLHDRLLEGLKTFPSPLRPVPQTLFQTDKSQPPEDAWKSWRELNPNITIEFFDDAAAWKWIQTWFGDGEIAQVYRVLEPVVLKADFLRYLLLLFRGGVYSDVDTECLKPLDKFGHIDESSHVFGNSSTNGQVANIVVGIEADVDDNGYDFMAKYWDDGLSRPLQIVQWTMMSSPYHPIYLDTVRRIVENTRFIEQWKRQREHELPYLGDSEAAHRLREEKPWQQINHRFDRAICDWTGPGVFTDSVMSYLNKIDGTQWPRFHGIPWTGDPVYIGDVKVGPFITYRPYHEHRDLPQALVQHFFANKWQHEAAAAGIDSRSLDFGNYTRRFAGHAAHEKCSLLRS